MNLISRREFLGASAAAALGASLVGAAEAPDKETCVFAALNDPHVKDKASAAIVERAAASINADPRITWVAVLGDLAATGAVEELTLAKRALETLERPCFVVPGNHDVALREEDVFARYKTSFGDVHWMHEASGWAFIGFNSCEGMKSFAAVADDEMHWLKERLSGLHPDTPTALFCHHPLNPNTRNYRIVNADAVLDLCAGRNLRLAAAGHWHGNQVEESEKILFATTACCSSTRNNFDDTAAKGYRLFHLQGEAVRTEFVEIQS